MMFFFCTDPTGVWSFLVNQSQVMHSSKNYHLGLLVHAYFIQMFRALKKQTYNNKHWNTFAL